MWLILIATFMLYMFTSIAYSLKVMSDLHQEIDRSFHEANIEIAFPQRDLHLRSIDDWVVPGGKE